MIAMLLSLFLANAPIYVADNPNSPHQNDMEIICACRPLLFQAGFDWQATSSEPEVYDEIKRRITHFYTIDTLGTFADEGYRVCILNKKIRSEKYLKISPEYFWMEDFFSKVIMMQIVGYDWSNAPCKVKTIGKDLYEYEQLGMFSHISVQGDFIIMKMILLRDKKFTDEEKAFWLGVFEKTPARAI